MKQRSILFAVAMAFATSPVARSQTTGPKLGDLPPPLGLEQLLQAPDATRADWDALKGKVVVLEFWATWCGPCVAAIPHLNELADEFKDQPVQFIAVTDEEEKVVSPFLLKKPIHAWIGLDRDKSMFKDYGVTGIPHTVVVDRTGRIAAITSPTEMSARNLYDLLAGRRSDLAARPRRTGLSFRPGELPESATRDRETLFQVLIRPSESLESGWGGAGGKFTFIGSSVMSLLSGCYGVNSTRIITNSDLPEGKFDVVVKTPAKRGPVGNNWLRQAVEATFGLTARRETREMNALVLTVANPKAEHLTPTASNGGSYSHSGSGKIQTVNMPISSLAASLESLLKEPVLDETGRTNRYDWDLQWPVADAERSNVDALSKAVREQLGLELRPARRPVEVLVVDKVAKQDE